MKAIEEVRKIISDYTDYNSTVTSEAGRVAEVIRSARHAEQLLEDLELVSDHLDTMIGLKVKGFELRPSLTVPVEIAIAHIAHVAKKPAYRGRKAERADKGGAHFNGDVTARHFTEIVLAQQCGNGIITNKTIERDLQKISNAIATATNQKGFDPRSNAGWNMLKMEEEGLVVRTDKVYHESRIGRPLIVWNVTPKGIEYLASRYPDTAAARVNP
jgi:hypothetical protein